MDQKASVKAEGLLATKVLHVAAFEAHEPEDQTAPAQAPHSVVSKTICWFEKKDGMSQPPWN